MIQNFYVQIAVEDVLSENVLRAMLVQSNPRFSIQAVHGLKGNSYLRSKISQFNQAARKTPFIVLTDLDQITCPPVLIKDWLGAPVASGLVFRVAVREVESWVMAHREAFAQFLGVPIAKIPMNTDSIPEPKEFLLQLVRRSSNRELKRELLPKNGWRIPIGPGYNETLSQFVYTHWKAKQAVVHSESLRRALNRLKEFRMKQSSGRG